MTGTAERVEAIMNAAHPVVYRVYRCNSVHGGNHGGCWTLDAAQELLARELATASHDGSVWQIERYEHGIVTDVVESVVQ